MAAAIVIKPSYKSWSFWFSVIVAVCGVVTAAAGVMKDKPYMVVAGTVASAVIVAVNSISNAFKAVPNSDNK